MGLPITLPQVKGVQWQGGSAMDPTKADVFPFTLAANATLTITSGAYIGQIIYIAIQQNATGGFSVTWPTSFTGAPNVKQAANALTAFSMIWNGSLWNLFGGFSSSVQTAYTNATTGMTSVPDWGWSIAAGGHLHVKGFLAWQNGTSNDAIQYQLTGPTIGAGSILLGAQMTGTVGGGAAGATVVNKVATAFATPITNSLTTVTASTNFLDIIEIDVFAGATAGTVQVQAAALTGGTVTIAAGSSMFATAN